MADLKVNKPSIGQRYEPMLAKVYDPDAPVGLRYPVMVQPKYDGMRLLWDGRGWHSRSGKGGVVVPDWVAEEVGRTWAGVALDGELYGHGLGFDQLSSLARRGSYRVRRDLHYVVFDMPSTEPFVDRWTHLEGMKGWDPEGPVRLSPTAVVMQEHQLEWWMKEWTGQGYEGMMIRDPAAGYEHRRTSALMKWKRTITEQARVVGEAPGKGKHQGRMGALEVEGVGGHWRCSVGTGFSDEERERGDWAGKVVWVAYQEKSSRGTPRFPRFVSVVGE